MKSKLALLPFIVFIGSFIGLNWLYQTAPTSIKDDFAIFAVFIALIVSCFTFKPKTSINDKVAVFVQGVSQPLILHMCFIFMVSTIFTHILHKIGSIQEAVDLTVHTISISYILPFIFLITSLFSLIIGSSMGTIASFMPIAHCIALDISINPSLMAGIVVSGSMFGDNISILSDTTMAAIKITGSNVIEKTKKNLTFALPTSFITIIILWYLNVGISHTAQQSLCLHTFQNINYIKITPYIFTFFLALCSIDTLAVLILGSIFSIVIGLHIQSFNFLESTNLLFNGFYQNKEMVSIFMLVLLLAGLSKIIEHNGGIQYLLSMIKNKAQSARHAKIITIVFVFLINTAIAINTISIIIAGPIIKEFGKNKISNAEQATLLDIGACISQGILPYTPQLLLAASIAQVSPLSLLPHLHYSYLLLVALVLNITFTKKN